MAYAQEDDNIDDIVDVEGEENTVITEEEVEEEATINASADADTTILFIKPIHNTLSTLGIHFIFLYVILFYISNTRLADKK